MERGKIIVGLSGGVDSAVTAFLLKQEGWEVIGVTLKLCAASDSAFRDASRVAEALGIEHYGLDGTDCFTEHVMEPFFDGYTRGETPLPCALCNRHVKFSLLLKGMRDYGAHAVATGHYVQKRTEASGDGGLYEAKHVKHDQSFFLFNITSEQLRHSEFPLGGFSKEETRALALKAGLEVHSKRSSQNVCFIPEGKTYRDLLEEREQREPREQKEPRKERGDIITEEGEVLGKHHGLWRYTIGQRKGIGVGGPHGALYVIRKEHRDNTLIVGAKERLKSTHVDVAKVNWLISEQHVKELEGQPLLAKVRSCGEKRDAHFELHQTPQAIRVFLNEESIAMGQACVLYKGDRLIGGGWIHEPYVAHDPTDH